MEVHGISPENCLCGLQSVCPSVTNFFLFIGFGLCDILKLTFGQDLEAEVLSKF